MKFEELLNSINVGALKTLIENDTVFESKMMKASFPDIDIIKMPAIELYRLHFVLFHILYSLQNEYAKADKYLYVHFMRTTVLDYPDKKSCAYFNEKTMSFCYLPVSEKGNHCHQHNEHLGDLALESLSLKYFYLDKSNYDKLDSVTAESLLSGAWEILSNEFSLNDAYLHLGLHGHENMRTIKMRFRELCKTHHPDNGGDKNKFMTINRSYRMLTKWLTEANHLT